MSQYLISIDGPSGCGKSTVAKIIAKNQKIAFISSGNLYRIIAFFIEEKDDDLTIKKKLEKINIEYLNNSFYVNGEDFSKIIFKNYISSKASSIARNNIIRKFVNKNLQKIAKEHDLIMDGRDIGSKVLPNADLKIYLTASVFTRVKRREKELKTKGEEVNFFKLFWQVFKRDWNDSHRKIDPLIKPKDSVKISSNNKTVDEVVEIIEKLIKK